MSASQFILHALFGYVLGVFVETLVLLVALSPRHGWRRRLFAGLWLTSCTYPIVILVLPLCPFLSESRMTYLLVAETFAPVAECGFFWAAFHRPDPSSRASLVRDCAAILAANVLSFGVGEVLKAGLAIGG